MLSVSLDELTGIAVLEPDGKLSESDFSSAAQIIDPYIEKVGELQGIIINVESFPGWKSFGALVNHLKFVKDHHKHVLRVAFATNSPAADVGEHIITHFVSAEVKHFAFDEMGVAEQWVLDAR